MHHLKDFVHQLSDDVVDRVKDNKTYELFSKKHNIVILVHDANDQNDLSGYPRDFFLEESQEYDDDIRKVHMWRHQWQQHQELCQSRLKVFFKKAYKIPARKCHIENISSSLSKLFLQKYHIQSNCVASIKLGLYHDNDLVSLMTFGKARFAKEIEFEMLRFATKFNLVVQGGASKLLKHFVKNHNPNSLISYSDKAWNTGNGYLQMGFTRYRTAAPAYYYTKDFEFFENRVAYQKHKLKGKLETFDPNLTEWENMQANGFNRIWDCGTDAFVWTKPQDDSQNSCTSSNKSC